MPPPITRRSLLKAGLLGTFALASAGALYRVTASKGTGHRFRLSPAAHAALLAIIPVMLKDAAASAVDAEPAVERIQIAISGLPLQTQSEIEDLFGLLTFGPSRRFLAGLPVNWALAPEKDIANFLYSWRYSRFQLPQSAYQALHDLIMGSWYSDESTWDRIGYPGPPGGLN